MKRLALLLLLLPSTSFGTWTIEGGTGDTITKWKKDGALVCYQTITGVWYKANGDSAYYGQGGGGAAWGEITGTLSNQSDLNTALLGKQNTNEKGAANGYPSLDANSKVPTLYLGGSGADNTKYLRGDQTWATPAGGGGGTGPDATPRDRTEWWIQKNAGTLTTIANVGHATAPTARGTASNLSDSCGNFLNYASAAVVDSQGGWRTNVWNEVRIDQEPIITFLVKSGAAAADTQGCRIWCGLASVNTIRSSADPTANLVAFRFIPGTPWAMVCNDNSGTGTVTLTGTNIAVNRYYRLKLAVYTNSDATTDSAVFWINGVRQGAVTTNLPATTATVGYYCMISTTDATANGFRVKRIHMETK